MALFFTLLSTLLHAGWNVIARQIRQTDFMLTSSLVICMFGVLPVLLFEAITPSFIPRVWLYLFFSGSSLAVYYIGITRGYRSGDFSVVYPIARALPLMLIAISDIIFRRYISPIGWAGIVFIAVGCLLSPLDNLSAFNIRKYFQKTIFWVLLAAAGITGYTFIDSIAADMINLGFFSSLRYFVIQTMSSVVVYFLIMKVLRSPIHFPEDRKTWITTVIIATMIALAYTLVMLAYQLSIITSYIVALRQFSIVIGVVMAALLFKEKTPKIRLSAAVIITAGAIFIGLAG